MTLERKIGMERRSYQPTSRGKVYVVLIVVLRITHYNF